MEEWNRRVTDDDIVYVLGDMFMGKRDTWEPIVKLLRGTIRLVPGNHDQCHPMRSKAEKFRHVFREMGIEVQVANMILPEDNRFFLSHFPVIGDSGNDDRYPGARPTREQIGGRVLLHGHIHEKWRINNYKNNRTLNVGVDVNSFAPISLEEICNEFGMEY